MDNFSRCNNNGVRKDDEKCTNIVDQTQLSIAGTMQSTSIENIVQELFHKIDVQQTVIEKFTSEMNKLEADFVERSEISALELADLREKCNYLESRILLSEDSTSRESCTLKCDQSRNIFEATNKESKVQQRTTATNAPTVLGNDVEYVSAPRSFPAILHEDNNPVKQNITENNGANAIEDLGLKSNPIGALDELCINRNWEVPKYEFAENCLSKPFTYSVTCTLMAHTVRAEGMSKKESKRTAATLMYREALNITSGGGDHCDPSEHQVPTPVPENRQEDGILLDEVAAFATDRVDDEPAIASVVDEPAIASVVDEPAIASVVDEPAIASVVDEPAIDAVLDELAIASVVDEPAIASVVDEPAIDAVLDEPAIASVVDEPAIASVVDEPAIASVVDEPAIASVVDEPVVRLTLSDANSELNDNLQVSTIDESNHPALLAGHDNVTILLLPTNAESLDHDENRAVMPQVNESAVVVKEDGQPFLSPEIAQLAARLRLSNSPSVRELKELNSINLITVPSCIELVDRIIEEEGLTLDYDLISVSSITPNGNDLMSVQLTINSGALTFEGYGDVIYDCQEDSAYECLTRFKSMLQH